MFKVFLIALILLPCNIFAKNLDLRIIPQYIDATNHPINDQVLKYNNSKFTWFDVSAITSLTTSTINATDTRGIYIDGVIVDDGYLKIDDGKGFLDDLGNEYLIFNKTSSAITFLELTNNTDGNGVLLAVNGGTNEDFILNSKGTGALSVFGTNNYENNVTSDDDIPNKKWCDDTFVHLTNDESISGHKTFTDYEFTHTNGSSVTHSISSAQDANLILEADFNNTGGEDQNPIFKLKQDGGLVNGVIGLMGATSRYVGAIDNSLYIMTGSNNQLQSIQFVLGADDDFLSGATQLTLDGENEKIDIPNWNIDMNNNQINYLDDGTANSDAVNKSQLDTKVSLTGDENIAGHKTFTGVNFTHYNSSPIKHYFKSQGNVDLYINADTNNYTESDVPTLHFLMDGSGDYMQIGVNGTISQQFTGAIANTPYIKSAKSLQFCIDSDSSEYVYSFNEDGTVEMPNAFRIYTGNLEGGSTYTFPSSGTGSVPSWASFFIIKIRFSDTRITITQSCTYSHTFTAQAWDESQVPVTVAPLVHVGRFEWNTSTRVLDFDYCMDVRVDTGGWSAKNSNSVYYIDEVWVF